MLETACNTAVVVELVRCTYHITCTNYRALQHVYGENCAIYFGGGKKENYVSKLLIIYKSNRLIVAVAPDR